MKINKMNENKEILPYRISCTVIVIVLTVGYFLYGMVQGFLIPSFLLSLTTALVNINESPLMHPVTSVPLLTLIVSLIVLAAQKGESRWDTTVAAVLACFECLLPVRKKEVWRGVHKSEVLTIGIVASSIAVAGLGSMSVLITEDLSTIGLSMAIGMCGMSYLIMLTPVSGNRSENVVALVLRVVPVAVAGAAYGTFVTYVVFSVANPVLNIWLYFQLRGLEPINLTHTYEAGVTVLILMLVCGITLYAGQHQMLKEDLLLMSGPLFSLALLLRCVIFSVERRYRSFSIFTAMASSAPSAWVGYLVYANTREKSYLFWGLIMTSCLLLATSLVVVDVMDQNINILRAVRHIGLLSSSIMAVASLNTDGPRTWAYYEMFWLKVSGGLWLGFTFMVLSSFDIRNAKRYSIYGMAVVMTGATANLMISHPANNILLDPAFIIVSVILHLMTLGGESCNCQTINLGDEQIFVRIDAGDGTVAKAKGSIAQIREMGMEEKLQEVGVIEHFQGNEDVWGWVVDSEVVLDPGTYLFNPYQPDRDLIRALAEGRGMFLKGKASLGS